jgi:hypothetical protein
MRITRRSGAPPAPSFRGDRAAFYHWAKVAAEVARIAPRADIEVVQAVVAEVERNPA